MPHWPHLLVTAPNTGEANLSLPTAAIFRKYNSNLGQWSHQRFSCRFYQLIQYSWPFDTTTSVTAFTSELCSSLASWWDELFPSYSSILLLLRSGRSADASPRPRSSKTAAQSHTLTLPWTCLMMSGWCGNWPQTVMLSQPWRGWGRECMAAQGERKMDVGKESGRCPGEERINLKVKLAKVQVLERRVETRLSTDTLWPVAQGAGWEK